MDNNDVDTRILPRIEGVHKDAEIEKFRITDWFRRERIFSDEGKFSYIIQLVRMILLGSLTQSELSWVVF